MRTRIDGQPEVQPVSQADPPWSFSPSLPGNAKPQPGAATAAPIGSTQVLVAYTALAGDVLAGYLATATRDSLFWVTIDGVTHLPQRANAATAGNATVALPVGITLTAGALVRLKALNEGLGSGDYQAELLIA